MKVLHISTMDYGGAGNAALRLHLGLKSIGVSSEMLVLRKKSSDKDVIKFKCYNLIRSICKIGYNLDKHPFVKKADIINLHWINWFVDYSTFFSTMKKPLIWSVYDMSPFTGGCHYSDGCLKYQTVCNTVIFGTKEKSYKTHNIHAVTPSRWLADCAKKSALFGRFKISTIPCGLPISIFIKRDKYYSRHMLELPQDTSLILFGADYKTERKGLKYLTAALKIAKSRIGARRIALVIFGNTMNAGIQEIGFPVYHLGYIRDEVRLSHLYSAGDLLVMPSLEEGFGYIALESLACGTPVVGFNVGGIPHMVKPEETGLLAERGNIEELAEKIGYLLSHPQELERMGKNGRKLVEEEHSLEDYARRYLELYEGCLIRCQKSA